MLIMSRQKCDRFLINQIPAQTARGSPREETLCAGLDSANGFEVTRVVAVVNDYGQVPALRPYGEQRHN